MHTNIEQILREIREALDHISSEHIDQISAEITKAQNIFVCGLGRTGLMCQALAMRLMHLGLNAHVVGEITAPAIGRGDLLIACSGSGAKTMVVETARKARAIGARVLAVTASSKAPLTEVADVIIADPSAGHHMSDRVSSRQFGGSLFEQSILVLLDAVVLNLMDVLDQTEQEMNRRHTNLP